MSHMNKQQLKQLNKLITHPLAEMLVGDVVRTLEEANGTYPVSDRELVILSKAIVYDLKLQYKPLEQIGKVGKVKHLDLEVAIKLAGEGKY